MRLSSIEIRNKEFKKQLFGLNTKEVQEFIELIAETIDDINIELDQSEHQIPKLKNTIKEWESKEDEIRYAIESAKSKGNQIIESAKREGQKLFEQYQNEIEKKEYDFQIALERKKSELYELHTFKEGFIRRLLSLFESQKKLIESFDQLYEIRETRKFSINYGGEFLQIEQIPDLILIKNCHYKKRRIERGKNVPDNAES